MNAKLTILILVALIAAVLVPVSAENVYVDRNPAKFDVAPMDSYGYLIVYVRGVTVQDPLVFIDHEKSNRTFDLSYHPDHSVIVDQNKGMIQVKLLPDGVSEPILLAAGNYTAYMRQGNSDQPEQYDFKIGGGATERVVFLGAAIPPQDSVKCKNFTVVDVGEWWEHFGAYDASHNYVGTGNGDYIRTNNPEYQEYNLVYIPPVLHEASVHYQTVCSIFGEPAAPAPQKAELA